MEIDRNRQMGWDLIILKDRQDMKSYRRLEKVQLHKQWRQKIEGATG